MLKRDEVEFLKLLMRSPDHGEGWRTVSSVCWKLVEMFSLKELMEIDTEGHRVRLTEKGKTVVEFAI